MKNKRRLVICLGCIVVCTVWVRADAISANGDEAEWAVPSSYRMDVIVTPGHSARVNCPVGAAIDFKEVFRKAKIPGRLDRDSIRVVRFDPQTRRAIPYHGRRNGYEIPCQMTGDFPNEDAGVIWWRMADRDAMHYHVYFDSLASGKRPRPEIVGLVGIGDMFHYNNGQPGFANAVALHSQYWHVDWDGDGLRDLIGFGYRAYEYGEKLERELGNAVYFHKNIGTAQKPLFAPRYRVKGADGAYLQTDLLPQNMFPADWDADGDMDFYGALRGEKLGLWENTGRRDRNNLWLLKPPRVIAELDQVSEFRKSVPGVKGRARFSLRGVRRVDWEGDGDFDLLAAFRKTNRLREVAGKEGIIPYGAGLMIFELFENVQEKDEEGNTVFAQPKVIRDERGIPINAFSVATGCAEYCDWDADGDFDLLFYDETDRPLEGGRLMYAENRGSRKEPLFSMPIPILQVWDSPFVADWNEDGLFDLIAGSEFFENTNPLSCGRRSVEARTKTGSTKPHAWSYPKLVSRGFAQQVQPIIVSYFAVSVDWDGNGVLDMLRGHHCNVLFSRNVGTALDPVFEPGVALQAANRPIYMANWLDPQAEAPSHWGPQGPSEPIYGWLNPTVGDWDGDGDIDLFVTGQRWQTQYFENVGQRTRPQLAAGREVRCEGNPHEFSWRSKVSIGDIDGDGVVEMVATSDRDNRFYAYTPKERQTNPGGLDLRIDAPLMLETGAPATGWYGTQNNNGDNHSLLVDWDNDGDLDLINGSLWAVWYYENVGNAANPVFKAHGRFRAGGEIIHTFNHAGSVDAADWNNDGRLDLVLSAECPSDQPHGAGLHLFDRNFIENDLPVAETGSIERR